MSSLSKQLKCLNTSIENLINIKNSNPEKYNLQHFNHTKTNNTIPVKVTFNNIKILNEIINEIDNHKRHTIILYAIEDEYIIIEDHNDTTKFNIYNYELKTCRIYNGILWNPMTHIWAINI